VKFHYQKLPVGKFRDPDAPLIARPFIPVYLIGHSQRTESPYYALVDSGADGVLFPSDLAKEIGIEDIKTHSRYDTGLGVAGRADIYYHSLKLQVLGDTKELSLEIGFSDTILVPILGRSFFRCFTSVIFREAKEELELKL
jgi:predicted aspartyl protease